MLKNHSTSSFDQEAMRHISEEDKLQRPQASLC